MDQPRILIVDDEESLRHMLSLSLSREGFAVWTAASGDEALDLLGKSERFDVCVTDVRMPGMDGLALIAAAQRLGDRSPTFIAMSAYGDKDLAVEALRRGAFDYISKPFEPSELGIKVRLVVERNALSQPEGTPTLAPGGRPGRKPLSRLRDIVLESAAMREIARVVRKVASFPTTVLITGETGTGKERIASALHTEGTRAEQPFVAVNCGAIPDNLLESELFGHKKGAFTDASEDRSGLIEEANGGTLFLDEIAEMPVPLQVKLLRVLVESEVRRVGTNLATPVDIRVVAATSRDVEAMVAAGTFREDLYHRLNVVSVKIPPLRERVEDLPKLIEHLRGRFEQRLGLRLALTDAAVERLRRYRWPGNIRELENALERALVLSDGTGALDAGDLDERFDEAHSAPVGGQVGDLTLKSRLRAVEADLIREALSRTEGNRQRAAELLGISQRALLYKLKEYGIR